MNRVKQSAFIIADSLSAIRVGLAMGVLFYSWQANWDWAYMCWMVGWGTDLFDGLAARRYGSLRSRWPGLDLDGISDTVLAMAGSAVPVVYAWSHYPQWITIILATLWVGAVVSGAWMATQINSDSGMARRLIRYNMLIGHGLIQIGGTSLWLAYMAGGWGLVWLNMIGLVGIAWIQWDKMMAWWSGRLSTTTS